MGYISLPSILNAIIDITSYCCVILKMVILHESIKTIQSVFFSVFLKKEENIFSFQKNPKTFFFKKTKKNRWIVFL